MRKEVIAAVGITLGLLVVSGTFGADEAVEQIRQTLPSWMDERDDPKADGWGSEVYSDVVSSRLRTLAAWMQGEAPFPAELVHAQFEAGTMIPADQKAAYSNAGLTVRHPDRFESPQRPSLRPAIEEWMSPLAAMPSRRISFKLVELKPMPSLGVGGVETRVRLQAFGKGEAGAVQLNTIWRCSWLPSADGKPAIVRIDAERQEEVVRSGAPNSLFSDCTESVLGRLGAFHRQLRYGNEYWMRRLQSVLGIDNYGHQGIAVGDINGDGLEDLYLPQTGGMPNLLLLQNEDGTVSERAAAYGVDLMERTHGALLIDLDNDGVLDLVLSTQHGLLVLRQVDGGSFELVDRKPISGYSIAAADYDLDGDLDLYATAYVGAPEWERQGGLGLEPLPYHDANNGAPNRLYRNDGDWIFSDQTEASGLNQNNRRWSFAAAWADFDDDGDPDLYVANDFGRNNLYRNDSGRFVDVAAAAGVEDSASGMSVAWADADGDGLIDLYVGNMFSAAGNRIVPQANFLPRATHLLKTEYQRFARGNTLYRNLGDGTFADVSQAAGVAMGRWSWSSPFIDLNNDGREDLVVANGYLTNEHKDDL